MATYEGGATSRQTLVALLKKLNLWTDYIKFHPLGNAADAPSYQYCERGEELGPRYFRVIFGPACLVEFSHRVEAQHLAAVKSD